MWDLKIDTRRLVEGFSTSVLWDRPNILWNKADDWWNDNYVTDSNTAAFLSATGIIDPNKQNYVNNLVIALKNQGLWNKMKAIYPFVSEQRNYLNYTEDFSNSYWSINTGTKTPNYAAAPNGTTTACRIFGGGFIQVGMPKQPGTYVFSFYVKMTAGGTGTLRVFLDGGVTTTTVNVTAAWTRVQVSQTFASVDTGTVGFYIDSDVLIWAPQFELGSTATDYQVTINAQEQFAAAYKYNLKDPQDTDAAFRLKIFGTWTFTPTGALPNGTNAYMDTQLTPSISLLNANHHISFYSRTNSAASSAVDMGVYEFTFGYSGPFVRAKISNQLQYGMGTNSSYNDTLSSNTDSRGHFIGNILATNNRKTYKNGAVSGVNATTGNADSGTGPIFLLAVNRMPLLASSFSDKECAFASIGDGLLDSEASALYTIVQQFQTSMNRQINP